MPDIPDDILDDFYDWIERTKFKEIEEWCAGDMPFNKDNLEACIEYYVEAHEAELLEDFESFCDHCGHTQGTGACFYCKMD